MLSHPLWLTPLTLCDLSGFANIRFLLINTEQMDAEGLGRKLLLTPSGHPHRTPEKQTVVLSLHLTKC